MPWTHLLLALAVVAVWGTNFVVIRHGLDSFAPLAFATLRFAFSALPWMLLIARPAVPWRRLAAFGVLLGVGQFGLLFLAMHGHITPGLASLVVQVQVFFTIGLSLLLYREAVRAYQLVGLACALGGLGLIAAHLDAYVSVLGLTLVLLAALFWACANLVAKSAGRVDMLGFMVWSSAFAVPPLALLSLLLEGPQALIEGVRQASAAAWGAVLWQALGNTLFGYGAWNGLLSRHSAASVAPLALLVPVFGMGASAWWLGEPLPLWKLGAAALVLLGLALIVLWPRWRQKALAREAATTGSTP